MRSLRSGCSISTTTGSAAIGIGILAWAFPAIWCALFILMQEPVAMVAMAAGWRRRSSCSSSSW
ncbi:MAG: hypothetical protein R3F11_00445 [Verrucomicrobiales bacterium]